MEFHVSRYSWCNQRLIDDNFAYLSSLKLSDLIPFESSDPEKRKSHKRMVIGHNVGFDRSFIKEQYYFEVSTSFYQLLSYEIVADYATLRWYISEERFAFSRHDEHAHRLFRVHK